MRKGTGFVLQKIGLLFCLLFFPSQLQAQSSDQNPQAPSRVVSMNLCTDQLAMMIAAPGQLISVSYLAANDTVSVMSAAAKKYILNYGKAEEIFRLQPDLVIAGTYTTRATVTMLKRLGRPFIELAPASHFDDIRDNIRKLGQALGRSDRANRIIKAFDARLAAIQEKTKNRPLILGSYSANSYTTGGGTLESTIIEAAGYRHLGRELGLKGTSKLSLEKLILANPDRILLWQRLTHTPTRATEILHHPALKQWFGPDRRQTLESRYWICGTPFTLNALQQLHDAMVQQKIVQRETP